MGIALANVRTRPRDEGRGKGREPRTVRRGEAEARERLRRQKRNGYPGERDYAGDDASPARTAAG